MAPALPPASALFADAASYTFHDIQCRPLKGRPSDINTVIAAFLGASPRCADSLMRLRDTLVRPFGLKTAQPWATNLPQPPYRVGQTLGIFRLLQLTGREVIMGEDDRHLDFRISLLVDGSDLYMSTLVRPHNLAGRFYLRLVLPFHHLIVGAMASRLMAQLDAPKTET